MSATVIDLAEYRREHPRRRRIEMPILLPSWPFGWLAPIAATMTIEI
jgi:hypothetical protein